MPSDASANLDLRALIEALIESGADFVVIGGIALVLHGSARGTQDLDICYARTEDNLIALERALSPFGPRLRGAPAGLPFRVDAATLRAGLNFTLSTEAGDIDLMGEVAGAGNYDDIVRDAVEFEVYGRRLLVMSLDTLESETSSG